MTENTTAPFDYSKLFVPAAIVIAGIIIGIFAMIGLSKFAPATAGGTGTQPTVAVNINDVKTDGDPFIGNANAPVTIAYWSDYQCPFCKAVEVGGVNGINIGASMPTLIKDYVNTGKLKIVFKDYPFLGNDSTTAALYEHAIWKLYPSKFYQWREAMFKAQDAEGDTGFGNASTIDTLIKTIAGLDDAKIKADVAANTAEYQKQIDADRAEGTAFGITGTPGFITGTTLIPGAAELATFTAAIDAQLK
ncbi:MAG: protein-disulfide isomerase [Candidatus Kaiserbacteria bacterium]|nr:protein-disulfide isomerase [Candidatus Kaiserbacteria bacterium]